VIFVCVSRNKFQYVLQENNDLYDRSNCQAYVVVFVHMSWFHVNPFSLHCALFSFLSY